MSKENDQHIAAQQKTVAQVAQYYYNPNGEVHGFDSLGLDNAPDVLKSLFDSIGIDQHKNVHGAVAYGVEQYKARNGGEMPHPQVVASALAAAARAAVRHSQRPHHGQLDVVAQHCRQEGEPGRGARHQQIGRAHV